MSEHKLRISAKGFFFNSKDEVLLVVSKWQKRQNESCLVTPGGGVEEGEDLRSAVERELLEETGYFGIADNVVYLQDFLNKGQSRQLEVFFIGHLNENKAPLTDHDHEFKFVSETEFQKISFLPQVNPFELREKVPVDYDTYLLPKKDKK